MAGRMVGMRLRVDEEAHRHRGDLLDGLHDRTRIGRLMPAVDQHHSVLCQNDAGVGFEVLSDVNVDAVAEFLELWSKILCTRGRARNTSDERDPYCRGLDPHGDPPDNQRSAPHSSLAGIPRKVACPRGGATSRAVLTNPNAPISSFVPFHRADTPKQVNAVR